MSSEISHPPVLTPYHVSLVARVFGLGSVFGKTLRDSRRAMLIVSGFMAFILFVSGSAIAGSFGTVESRAEAVALTRTLPPIFLGLFGGPQPNVGILGGFVNWRFGLVFFLMPGVWSLLALSSTLVGEARRGTLEFVAVTGVSRRKLALQKLGGHLAAVTVVMAAVVAVMWVVGNIFAVLPGDPIPLGAAAGYALLMGITALATGAIAFALASFIGRGAAAGVAGGWMFASWVVWGYRDSIPLFDSIKWLSWYSWTAGHRPIAGTYDWLSMLPLVAIIIIGLGIGVLAFERRDIGNIGGIRMPSLPRALLGIRGPFGRTLAERITGIIGWGGGLGLYALVIASSGESLRQSISDNPAVAALFRKAFPNVDLQSSGFSLELAFLAFGYLGIAIAASTIVGSWSSDESEGRLEMVLATSMARLRWFLSSALATFLAVLLVVSIVAAGVAIGVGITGAQIVTPVIGTGVLVLYGAAAGIGLAVGGLFRTSLGAPAILIATVSTMLLDIIVPALKLPDWMRQLALTAHFGNPMLGTWDPVGIAVSLLIAVAGLAVGAWGFTRRDLRP